ncbi:MAG: response regulator transcription factor [Lachnospiraceae bacterium]|nr:response regulator transcription factor [Lachnospiraceae bacterium]MDY5741820.1 response regulator transcription factor [Lachnospiraceae bacterium]
MRLLLVEDEKRMGQALCELLKQENYEVEWFIDGQAGAEAFAGDIYDLAVLDVMLPHKSGFDIVREVRKNGIKTPILMLTARSETDDKVNGLDCGADDYLTKPFVPQELLARLRALTRRQYDTKDGNLTFGDITLETGTLNLVSNISGLSVRLSDKEFRALEVLIANQGQILTREQLATKIWGYENEAEYNNVEVYMTFVRKKLAFIGSMTAIKAVRGVGYELRAEHV